MIIHLGFPKCASTALQRLLIQGGDSFIGCNPKALPGHFYDENIGNFFESVFRFGSDKAFNDAKHDIKRFLKERDQEQSGKLILSYENLCFRLVPPDLPTDIKIKRLSEILPESSRFLILKRPLQDFLISLYKNYLSFGYTGNFQDFLMEIVMLGPCGFLYDLDYEELYNQLRFYFENNHIVFADIGNESVFEDIFNLFELPGFKIDNLSVNKSFDDDFIETMRSFNLEQPPRKKLTDWMELHRAFPSALIEESELFYLSRHRKMQNQHAAGHPDNEDFRVSSSIKWPDAINALDQKNTDFMNAAKRKFDVSVL